MPQKDLLNIKAVTMAMWDPYIKSIKKWCPNAVIVFDKFHIIAKFNKEIDKVRRSEQNRKDLDQQEKRTLKNNRWILLKTGVIYEKKKKPGWKNYWLPMKTYIKSIFLKMNLNSSGKLRIPEIWPKL